MSIDEAALAEPADAHPEQWADQPLARYLAAAWRNSVRTIRNEPALYDALAEIDGVFRRLVAHADESPERIAGAMLVRTHGSLLAASSLALGGQVAEAYALMRSALRSALLGVFIAGNDERQQIWVARADDDRAAERAQATFANGPMLRHLRDLDAATAGIYERLHQRTIERGAHPNVHGPIANDANEDSIDFSRCYLVVEDDVQRMALRSTAQVGICTLSMLYYVFGDLYREYGLDGRLTKLRQGH